MNRSRAAALVLLGVSGACGHGTPTSGPEPVDRDVGADAAVAADVPADPPDAAAETVEWTTCDQVFVCMAAGCAPPPPPPAAGIPPPPVLPTGASAACLAGCAGRIVGAERVKALQLGACAQQKCDSKVCAAAGDAASCLENCLWTHCQKELAACPGKVGFGGCAGALACAWSTPSYDQASLLDCARYADWDSVTLYTSSLACELALPDDASGCAATLEQCACDRPPPAPGQASCLSVFVRGRQSNGPCGQSLRLATLRAPSRPLAEAFGSCVAKACASCSAASCVESCAVEHCTASYFACLGDAPGAQPGSGTGTCRSAVPCLDACRTGRGDGCHGTCAAAISATAWAQWQALQVCAIAQCSCSGKDPACDAACRAGPCKAAWDGCGG